MPHNSSFCPRRYYLFTSRPLDAKDPARPDTGGCQDGYDIQKGDFFQDEVFHRKTMWSQMFDDGVINGIRAQDSYFNVLREFQAKTPVHIPGTESCMNCTLTVTTLGFDYTNCSTSTFPLYLSALSVDNPRIEAEIFRTEVYDTTWSVEGRQWVSEILVNVTRAKSGPCHSPELVNQECWLLPSLVNYTLELNEGIATFASGSNWKADHVVVESEATGAANDRVRYIRTVGYILWKANTIKKYALIGPSIHSTALVEQQGLLSYLYWQGPQGQGGDGCNIYFPDTMDDILNCIRDVIFRLSVKDTAVWNGGALSNNLPSIYQSVNYTSHQNHVIYVAQLPALVLATAVSFIGPLATLVLFWEWWKLGRDFSMNPLELANAFLLRPAQTTVPNIITTESNYFEYKHAKTSLEEVTETVTTSIDIAHPDSSPPGQIHNQLAALPLLASGSSNAPAKQIVEHIRRRTQKGERMNDVGDGRAAKYTRDLEPTIQYGVLHATGRLGFAVSDPDGQYSLPPACLPRRGEVL